VLIPTIIAMEAKLEPTALVAAAGRLRRPPAPAFAEGSTAFADTLARAKRSARRMRARRPAPGSWPAAVEAPPPEVQREMAAAARACQTLAAQGKELRFDRTADGRVSVELIDVAGCPLDLTPSGLFSLLQQAA
jgi:hypothetical protein